MGLCGGEDSDRGLGEAVDVDGGHLELSRVREDSYGIMQAGIAMWATIVGMKAGVTAKDGKVCHTNVRMSNTRTRPPKRQNLR